MKIQVIISCLNNEECNKECYSEDNYKGHTNGNSIFSVNKDIANKDILIGNKNTDGGNGDGNSYDSDGNNVSTITPIVMSTTSRTML